MLISGSIFDRSMCRIRGDGKKFVSISDLTQNFKDSHLGTLIFVRLRWGPLRSLRGAARTGVPRSLSLSGTISFTQTDRWANDVGDGQS